MAYADLAGLATVYPARDRSEILGLAERYRGRNEREILELGTIASEVGVDDITRLGLEPDTNPQLLEAFKSQYPNVDPESLVGRSSEELAGFVSGVKGKYFEVLVKDRLNEGESIGELQLAPGQEARLAEFSTQEGWDLQIVDQHGEMVEQLQAKATASMSPVTAALRDNPDIPVVVPDNLDSTSPDVIGTDVSWEELNQTTEQQIGEMSESVTRDVLENTAELGVDFIPGASILVIGILEGRRVLTGCATLRQAIRDSRGRLARAAAYNAIASPLGPVGIPVAIGARVAQTRVSAQVDLGDHLASRTAELQRLPVGGEGADK